MSVRWIETTQEAYSVIYIKHGKQFEVFGTYTHCDEPVEMLTEWGFAGADYPLIKSWRRGEEYKFYIASVTKDSED